MARSRDCKKRRLIQLRVLAFGGLSRKVVAVLGPCTDHDCSSSSMFDLVGFSGSLDLAASVEVHVELLQGLASLAAAPAARTGLGLF